MRRLIILCVLCVLCGSIEAASEIRSFNAGATTCFAVVRNTSGQVWYVTGQVFETWGTAGRTAADYDIALTNKTGGMFVGTMDTNIAAGQYYIVSHQQAGVNPADTDPATWQEFGDWTGTVWTPATITPADVADAVWDEAMADHTGETTFGGEVQQLDPNITLIKAVTDIMEALNTTVAAADDANSFTLTDGNDVNDCYTGMTIYVEDATTGDWASRLIDNWETGKVVTVDSDFAFTPEVGDIVVIWGIAHFPIDVLEEVYVPPDGETIIVDTRAAVGAGGTTGGTRTLDVDDEDPP